MTRTSARSSTSAGPTIASSWSWSSSRGRRSRRRLERGPLPQADVIGLGQAIASGLDAAHRQGVVHRDLKPGNIILSRNGVQDPLFGLARTLTDESTEADETRGFNTGIAGAVLGTLPYMAPEQLQGGRADARTDVFALGAVLYEMATGCRAFDATSHAGIIAAVLDHQPPAASAKQTGLSPLIDRAIAQCLAQDPHARPQTAGEVARVLALVGDAASAPAAPAAGFQRERLISDLSPSCSPLSQFSWHQGSGRRHRRCPPQPLVKFDIPLPAGGQLPAVPDVRNPVAMSPDGRHIVYPLTTGSTSQLWLHSPETSKVRPLRGTEGALAAFWSPSSRHIAFFTAGFLKRVSIEGDVVAPICPTTTQMSAGSWGADDTIVFSDNTVGALMRLPAGGGNPERLPSRAEPVALWPHLLPDGRHLLLLSGSGIQRGALDSEALTPVSDVRSMAVYAPSGHLWTRAMVRCSRTPSTSCTGRLVGEPRVISDGVQYFVPTGGAAFSASATGAVGFGATRRYPTDSFGLDATVASRPRSHLTRPGSFHRGYHRTANRLPSASRAQRQVLPTCGYSIR